MPPALRRRPDVVEEPVLAAIQGDREPAVVEVQDAQARVERRTAGAREADRPIVPTRLLRMISAVPTLTTRAARANAYGPNPPHLGQDVVPQP